MLGLRKSNPLLLYAAGLVAGFGFYTFFSARAALPIMLMFALTVPQIRRRILDLWPVALGVVLTITPLFIVNGREVISRMLAEVPGGYSSDITGPVLSRIVTNVAKNLLAFNYNPDVFHYVSGPLLDPITAVLAVLGVGLAVAHIREDRHRLLLLWTLVALFVTGIMSPYPQVAISRLHFVVPPLVLLAGFAADRLWTILSTNASGVVRRWVGLAAVIVFSLLILALNVRQFWIDTPRVFRLTQEAVAIGAVRSESCNGESTLAIIVGRSTEPLLKPALESYYPQREMPRLIDHSQLDGDRRLSVGSARCVVFANPDDPTAQRIIEQLKSEFPSGRTVEFSDEADLSRVIIFEPRTR